MGGIIEDKIFEVLMRDKLTSSEIIGGLEKISYGRKYTTINKHLRKMCYIKQLDREKSAMGKYAYYNPCMVSD